MHDALSAASYFIRALVNACILVDNRNNSKIATGVTPWMRFAAPSVTGLDLLKRSFSSDDNPRKLDK